MSDWRLAKLTHRLPHYNNWELSEIPYDFKIICQYRNYLDNVEEAINLYDKAPKPPEFVIHDPDQFHRWLEWARDFKLDEKKGVLMPFGSDITMEDGIEGFISFYDPYREIKSV